MGVAVAYSLSIATFESFRNSPAFKWLSPFVFPANAFIVRYIGQRTILPENTVSELGTTVSIMHYVISRTSQCVYLQKNADDIVLFFVLEIFYDFVGIIFKTTLHHRQMLIDALTSRDLWNYVKTCGGGGKGISHLWKSYGTARSRLISFQSVAQGCIMELH
eukprot:PhF_6_TR39572/c0_g1_i1/m.58662